MLPVHGVTVMQYLLFLNPACPFQISLRYCWTTYSEMTIFCSHSISVSMYCLLSSSTAFRIWPGISYSFCTHFLLLIFYTHFLYSLFLNDIFIHIFVYNIFYTVPFYAVFLYTTFYTYFCCNCLFITKIMYLVNLSYVKMLL